MKYLKNTVQLILLLIFYNIIPFYTLVKIPIALKVITTVVLSVLFVFTLVHSEKAGKDSKKLKRIESGCLLVKYCGISAIAEIIVLFFYIRGNISGVINTVFAVAFPIVFIAVTLFSGIIKILICSKQVKITDYIILLLFWWFPIVNIFLFVKFYKIGKREVIFETDKLELENSRAQNEICKTKYPILMVHGIFFRDWQFFNYWGRIPAALIRNGAEIYYGNQQSASSIERSASELRDRILEVINESGAEKVNIIAHSKGGLDSRYAISCLGMDKYVASLTTINTPHSGCNMVDYLFDKLPQSVIDFLTRKYNRIFSKLGDNSPDFIEGANDLRASRADAFNQKTPDSPDVFYQSRMSVMSSWRSAFFVLGISHLLIKKLDGDNDGLVYVESAKHGDFSVVSAPKRRGISHGDVIDLMRENIEGYDVREYYVDIIKNLKEKGL